jgi:hypothetical protein
LSTQRKNHNQFNCGTSFLYAPTTTEEDWAWTPLLPPPNRFYFSPDSPPSLTLTPNQLVLSFFN